MVGIALILDPKRKSNYLKNNLKWEDSWVNAGMEQFHSSFEYYRLKMTAARPVPNTLPTSIGLYGLKKK